MGAAHRGYAGVPGCRERSPSPASPDGHKPRPPSRALPKAGGAGLGYQPRLSNATRQTTLESLKSLSGSRLWAGHTFLVATVINFSSLLGFSSLQSCGWLRVKVQVAPGCRTCTSLSPPYPCVLLLIHTTRCHARRRQASQCKFNLRPLPLRIFPKSCPRFCSLGNTNAVTRQRWGGSPTGNASGA